MRDYLALVEKLRRDCNWLCATRSILDDLKEAADAILELLGKLKEYEAEQNRGQ